MKKQPKYIPAPTNDERLRMSTEEKLARVCFFIEADSFAEHELWAKHFYYNKEKDKLNWVQDNCASSIIVGHIDKQKKKPVVVVFSFMKIDDKYVCFYHPTSRYVDWTMIDEWIDKRYPVKYDSYTRRARTDANDFYSCLNFCKKAY
jgi:hypothetical protein